MAALTITDSVSKTLEPGQRKRKKSLSEEAVRVSNKPVASKVTDAEKPSEKMKKRQEEARSQRTLGEALAETAAVLPAGEGYAGRFLKNVASGAAAGATLGEYLAEAGERRRQKGKKSKPRTLSEKANDERGER